MKAIRQRLFFGHVAALLFCLCLAGCKVSQSGPLAPMSSVEPPGCGDFLAVAGAKPPYLEFMGCEAGMYAQMRILEAKYRVPGSRAAEVEDYLASHTGMARLRRLCCGWENWRETPGQQHDGLLPYYSSLGPEGPADLCLAVSMTSGETLQGSTRETWADIPWFYVTTIMYLESP